MERCGEVIGGLYDTSHFACKSDTTVVPDCTQKRLFLSHFIKIYPCYAQDNSVESKGEPF